MAENKNNTSFISNIKFTDNKKDILYKDYW